MLCDLSGCTSWYHPPRKACRRRERADQQVRAPDAQSCSGGATAGGLGQTNFFAYGEHKQKAQASTQSGTSGTGDRGDHNPDGQNHHTTRRPAGSKQDGQGLHNVHGTDGPNRHPDEPISGWGCVEPEAGRLKPSRETFSPCDLQPLHDTPRLDDPGAGVKARKAAGIQGGQAQVSQAGMAGRGGEDAVPNLGPREEEPSGFTESGVTSHLGGPNHPSRSCSSAQPRPRAKVSCAETLETHDGGRKQGGLQPRGQPQSAGGSHLVRSRTSPHRKLVLADYWHTSQAGHTAKDRCSPSATTSGIRSTRRPDILANEIQHKLLRQKLINRSNTCYVNACVMAILWQVADIAWPSLPEAWKQKVDGLQWYPIDFLRFVMMGWRDTHVQHDVSEYLGFLLSRLAWFKTMYGGAAEFRRMQMD